MKREAHTPFISYSKDYFYPVRPLRFYEHMSEAVKPYIKSPEEKKKTTMYRFNTKYQDIYIKILLITQQ